MHCTRVWRSCQNRSEWVAWSYLLLTLVLVVQCLWRTIFQRMINFTQLFLKWNRRSCLKHDELHLWGSWGAIWICWTKTKHSSKHRAANLLQPGSSHWCTSDLGRYAEVFKLGKLQLAAFEPSFMSIKRRVSLLLPHCCSTVLWMSCCAWVFLGNSRAKCLSPEPSFQPPHQRNSAVNIQNIQTPIYRIHKWDIDVEQWILLFHFH